VSPLSFLQRLPSPALGSKWLDKEREARVDRVLDQAPREVDLIRDACDVLLESPQDPAARAALATTVPPLLQELRKSRGGAVDRGLSLLDQWTRSDAPELLDRSSVPVFWNRTTVRALQHVNGLAGSYATWRALVLEATAGMADAHVYELAAGSGGFARDLAHHASDRVRITASDRSVDYVELGRRLAEQAGLSHIQFEVCDASDLRAVRARGDVDLFLCTQAAHHFPPGPLVQLLSHAMVSAKAGILVIDLARSVSAAFGTALVALVAAPWPGLIMDGFQSVRRAYTPSELSLLARLAGAQHVEAAAFGPAWCTLRAWLR
jgi:SAM-dependent methyltransferase